MGTYAQTSVLFYFPHVFEKKRDKWLLGQGDRKDLTESLKSYPDALLVRWINSLTGKMNGEVINGVHDTRSPDQSAWSQVLLHAAACSIGDPFLFVCVRGYEQWFSENGPNQMYFRVLRLRRKASSEKHAALSEHAHDSSKTILIRWGPNGFEFKVETQEDQNANVNRKWCGRPAHSESIPIRQDAQAIKGIGFRKVKGQSLSSYVQLDGENRYWLPSSITELILTRLKVDTGIEIRSDEAAVGWQYDYLNEYFVLRTEEAKVRVSGKRNAEISVSILDADGNTYISQRLTHSSRKRRREDIQ